MEYFNESSEFDSHPMNNSSSSVLPISDRNDQTTPDVCSSYITTVFLITFIRCVWSTVTPKTASRYSGYQFRVFLVCFKQYKTFYDEYERSSYNLIITRPNGRQLGDNNIVLFFAHVRIHASLVLFLFKC